MRKLEERYGVLLFHRNKRSVRLSELGERLLAVTQRLFAIEAEAEELLSASSAPQTGTLTLAVDAPVHVLPQIARVSARRHPGIAVRVETGLPTSLCSDCSATRTTWLCWAGTSATSGCFR